MEKLLLQQLRPPVLLLHGGAGSLVKSGEVYAERSRALEGIAESCYPALLRGESAVAVAGRAVLELEACPLFNAGCGSRLQSDGQARLSASLMDGARRKFSAVNLVTHLAQPTRLTLVLQEREQSVLGPFGAQLLARELGLPPANPVTGPRAREWLEYLTGQLDPAPGGGTVGAVVCDCHGHLAAATSTGGYHTNAPERMSDSASVSGNYASASCAVSCSGYGEQIMDYGLAVRLETRVDDGMSLAAAAERVLQEAATFGFQFGWIALSAAGEVSVCTTTESITHAVRHGGS